MASTSHLLVLQQLDVQIFFGRPRRAGDVAQPCGGEVERGLTVRERAHDTRAPPDLAQDALERVVGANPPPVPTLRDRAQTSIFGPECNRSRLALYPVGRCFPPVRCVPRFRSPAALS